MSDTPKPPQDPAEYWLGLWSQWSAPVHTVMQSPVAQAFMREIHDAVQLAINFWGQEENRYAEATATLSEKAAQLLAKQDLENADIAAMQQQIFEIQSLLSEQLAQLIETTEPLSDRQKKLLHFSLRQLRAMLNPQNTLLANTELVTQAAETQGQLLINASDHYLQDLAGSHFGLQIRRTALSENILGEQVAATAGSVVFQNELIQLVHYQSRTEKQYEIPLLITPPCINRFYIFDMPPQESMVRWLLDQGQDVYMISWVNPTDRLSEKSFEDYVRQGCLQAIEVAAEIADVEQVNLVGYCIGGLFAAITASTEQGQQRIASLSLFATLLDYSDPGELEIFTSPGMLDAICSQAEEDGVLAADMLSTAFTFMREEQLFWRFFRQRYIQGREPPADALMYWGQDATNLPARMAVEYLRSFYGDNQLSKGSFFMLGEEQIRVEACSCPKYILACENDHIVPLKSALGSGRLLGGDLRVVQSVGGHVRGVFNHPDRQQGHYRVHGEDGSRQGSWWSDWFSWLQRLSGRQVEGKICAPAQYKSIEAAPGSYVRGSSRT